MPVAIRARLFLPDEPRFSADHLKLIGRDEASGYLDDAGADLVQQSVGDVMHAVFFARVPGDGSEDFIFGLG